ARGRAGGDGPAAPDARSHAGQAPSAAEALADLLRARDGLAPEPRVRPEPSRPGRFREALRRISGRKD
ncbi:hypothetical protein, partial [Planomonospora algeriensis]